MLMDLGRNDIGRVAQVGTVKVTENMKTEHYSHVSHIASNVDGKLKPRLGAMDLLRATFPAGTGRSAPKDFGDSYGLKANAGVRLAL